jgi:ABC-type multidrug transport system fused ATPase/permease subunit
VQPLAGVFEHWDRSAAAAGRILELVDREPPVRDPVDPVDAPPVAGAADVELADVRFRHVGADAAVLDGASFRVAAGATVALVGPSGSGKSTIVDLLLRFLAPDSGTVSVQGVDLATGTGDAARARVAVVAQHDHLFDTTVRDNLLVGDGAADDERMWAALAATDLDDVVRALPDGLDERLGEDGERLSGGERQRLMVARALLADAPVLVLDEATAHLDAPTRDRVVEGVRRWRRGGTTVVIAHDADTLAGVDRVLRLRGGRVVEEPLDRGNPTTG